MKNRIVSLKLTNIKSVDNGFIKFSDYNDILKGDLTSLEKSSVLGLYGQNGSGKTTAYDCFRFLKVLSLGMPLYQRNVNGTQNMIDNFDYLLQIESAKGKIEYEFLIGYNKKYYKVNYSVSLKRKGGHNVIVSGEEMTVYPFHSSGETWKYPFAPQVVDLESFQLDAVYDGVTHKNQTKAPQIEDLSKYTELYATKMNCITNGLSFIMSEININYLIKHSDPDVKEYGNVVRQLKTQIVNHLYTFKTSKEGLSEVGLGTILGIHIDPKSHNVTRGEFPFSLYPFTISLSQLAAYDQFINEMNVFISSFVPGFKLRIQELGRGKFPNGKENITITINRVVGKSDLPLSQESSGIRKLLSLTCAIVFVYGNDDGWLVIDEFDSGVFEELLGQIISVIQKNGKGQLLFTAHNLRPLERVPASCIMFTTANSKNRYINFKNISGTSNLRDCYFRALKLGGQSEELSSIVSDEDIDLALFDAYDALKNTVGVA